jgi:formamidopyrimidine-DNA glycosylase
MPELPDIALYVDRLSGLLVGRPLIKMRTYSPGVLKTFLVPAQRFEGKHCTGVSWLGKRIVLEFEDGAYIVIHLMIAGRFAWNAPLPETMAKKNKFIHANWDWPNGRLTLNEFSPKKRAGIYLVGSRQELDALNRGGIDVRTASADQFREAVTGKNQTVKRALTDPSRIDGIGNAYSDEILFHAKLSPVRRTASLTEQEVETLRLKAVETLDEWSARLFKTVKGFPKSSDITAFRPDFFVHGRYKEPCRVCGAPIQRIVYAENECNYCARCQNGGKVLADRSLSLLLKDEWPKMIEELE